MKSDSTWHVVQVDEVQAHEGKKPTKVKRSYEKVGGEANVAFGENENTIPFESPFEGATLQLSGDDEDVKVEFVDGKKPDHEGALVGHKLGLALDALLPDKEVEKDAHWDLDSGADQARARPRPAQGALPAPARSRGCGWRRWRRRRPARGMGRGGGMGGIPADAEWTGKAKLVSLDEDVDGMKCAKIEIEIGAHGDLPEHADGRRRPRPDARARERARALREHLLGRSQGRVLLRARGQASGQARARRQGRERARQRDEARGRS